MLHSEYFFSIISFCFCIMAQLVDFVLGVKFFFRIILMFTFFFPIQILKSLAYSVRQLEWKIYAKSSKMLSQTSYLLCVCLKDSCFQSLPCILDNKKDCKVDVSSVERACTGRLPTEMAQLGCLPSLPSTLTMEVQEGRSLPPHLTRCRVTPCFLAATSTSNPSISTRLI